MTSTNIYSKPLPYVYRIINRGTGEFYIGSRWANKHPAHSDLGILYFSSSKHKTIIQENLKEFEFEILLISESKFYVYEIEQEFIKINFKNPLILNGYFRDIKSGQKHFMGNINGTKRGPLSEEAKQNMRKPKSDIGKHNIKIAAQKRVKDHICSDETRLKISNALSGRTQTKEVIESRMTGVKRFNKNNPDKLQERIEKMKSTKEANPSPSPNKGILHSEETKQKMRKPKRKYPCPHCDYIGIMYSINKFHMNNCKNKK